MSDEKLYTHAQMVVFCDEAREQAAQIVDAENTCECRPDFCECYGYGTLDDLAAKIRGTHE